MYTQKELTQPPRHFCNFIFIHSSFVSPLIIIASLAQFLFTHLISYNLLPSNKAKITFVHIQSYNKTKIIFVNAGKKYDIDTISITI